MDRVYDFSLRRLLQLLSAVAEEAGFTRSNLTSASTVGNIITRMAVPCNACSTHVLTLTVEFSIALYIAGKRLKILPPTFRNVGVQKIFFARDHVLSPPTFKTVAPPLFKAYAHRGEKVFVKSGNCHIEHTAIFCLCYAVVFLYFTSYAYVHLTLYKDVLPMIQMLLA